jgi:ABC-type nitrate/sulfonate/bicarbonate transport system permease component
VRINAASIQNWILPVAALAAWEVLGRAGLLPRYLSTPSAILAALWELALTGELFVALAASLYRVSVGFALGTAAGIVVGLGAGMLPGVRHFFDPLVSFLYSIPKIAFLPIFLLLFGLGHASKIAVIAFSGFFPVFVASRYAVLSVDKLLIWAARNMGTPSRTIFFRVLIPAAAPQLFGGIRIGLAHAFVVLFAAELIGSVGARVPDSRNGRSWRHDARPSFMARSSAAGFLAQTQPDRARRSLGRRRLRFGRLGRTPVGGIGRPPLRMADPFGNPAAAAGRARRRAYPPVPRLRIFGFA